MWRRRCAVLECRRCCAVCRKLKDVEQACFGWSHRADKLSMTSALAGSDTLTSKSVQAVSGDCTCQRQLFSDRSACDAPRSPDIDHPSICHMFPAGHQPHNSAKQVLACGVHAAQGMWSATCRGSTHPPVTRSWAWRAVGQAVTKYGSWSLASVVTKQLSDVWTGQTRFKVPWKTKQLRSGDGVDTNYGYHIRAGGTGKSETLE